MINRSVFYGAKLITEQLEIGEFYGTMKPGIVISIVCGRLFPCCDLSHHRLQRRTHRPGVLAVLTPSTPALLRLLKERNIFVTVSCSTGLGGVRASFQHYPSKYGIEVFLQAVKEFIAQ